MDSLIIYDLLPEDDEMDYFPELSQKIIYHNIVQNILDCLHNHKALEATSIINLFSSFFVKCKSEGFKIDIQSIYELCEYCIGVYKVQLKAQRLGLEIDIRVKKNSQVFNYYLQNILSNYESSLTNDYNQSVLVFNNIYKLWDAAADDSNLYVVDSSSSKNFKVYKIDTGELIFKDNCSKPTKCNLIGGKVFVHSTYSNQLSLFDLSNFSRVDYFHSNIVRCIYEAGNEVNLIDDSGDLYSLDINTSSVNLRYIRKIDFKDFFIDSYVIHNDFAICSSHTSSSLMYINLKSFEVSFKKLNNVYMPNSLDVGGGRIYVCDKETGLISIYDEEKLELIDKFGFFSKKYKGNADTIKVLLVKKKLYIFSWLSDNINVVEFS